MQELLSVIEDAIKKKVLPKVPIFCSGLGMDLVNHFHEISKNTNRVRFNRKILRNIGVQPLPKKLEPGQEPPIKGIFLVSSGMLVENTPSYVIASSILSSEKTQYFLSGIATQALQVVSFLIANQKTHLNSRRIIMSQPLMLESRNSILVDMQTEKKLFPTLKSLCQKIFFYITGMWMRENGLRNPSKKPMRK